MDTDVSSDDEVLEISCSFLEKYSTQTTRNHAEEQGKKADKTTKNDDTATCFIECGEGTGEESSSSQRKRTRTIQQCITSGDLPKMLSQMDHMSFERRKSLYTLRLSDEAWIYFRVNLFNTLY